MIWLRQPGATCRNQSTRKGDVKAQVLLGAIYAEAEGEIRDQKKAAFWLRKAADQNDPYALFHIGIRHYRGADGEKDVQKAFAFFRRAADLDFAPAQFALGNMYRDGEGVEKSGEQAVYWFTKAAEAGSGEAQYNLGMLYETGELIPKNEEKGTYWIGRAMMTAHQYRPRPGASSDEAK